MSDKKILRIKVTPSAKVVIERIADAHDMKQEGVASRIYEWFGRQHDDIQRAILGLYGPRTPDVVPAILRRLGRQSDPPAAELDDIAEGGLSEDEKQGKKRRKGKAG